jgi:endonuclease YncB( thermonuclease family)
MDYNIVIKYILINDVMKKLLLLFICLLGVFSAQAAPEYGTAIVSKVISVYDGDTFRVDIDSLPPIVGKNIPIRLNGVDTPEIQGKCQHEKDLALKARDFVRNKLANAKEIKLTKIQRGKYFRVIADVIIDGVSLEQELLENKLAYKYTGGKKSSWCN